MRYATSLDAFDELVYCDSEYYAPAGHLPRAICVVAYQQRANRVTRWWLWGKRAPPTPAVFSAPRTLFLSYQSPAELVLFRSLGWALPETVLDLNMEVRTLTNGQTPKPFIGLHEAATRYGIPYLDAEYKALMRDIAMSGGPEIDRHRRELLDYCEEDTLVLVPLLQRLLPRLSVPHALLRGEYMRCRARIEARGIPINVAAYRLLVDHRVALREMIAQQANRELGCEVFDEDSLRDAPFARFIRALGLGAVWPQTPTGKFAKDTKDTLERFRHTHPHIEILRGAKKSLDDLNAVALAIGPDRRNRTGGGAFGTITGRYNSPRNREAILLRSKWWRNLIRPGPSQALAYLDFSAEEFLVLAVLADDPQGLADYYGGDVYTTFGRATGLIPPGAQRKVPGAVRDMLKVVVLSIPYGGRAPMLAQVAGIRVEQAGRLIQAYRERYPRMAQYVEDTVHRAVRTRRLRTRLDWRLSVGEVIESKREFGGEPKPANVVTLNTLRDWPIQANAGEILRLSVIDVTAAGVDIVATLHDAVLIEAACEQIEEAVQRTRQAMERASAAVLFNPSRTTQYPLRVEASIVRYPDHYRVTEEADWWGRVREMLRTLTGQDLEALAGNAAVARD